MKKAIFAACLSLGSPVFCASNPYLISHATSSVVLGSTVSVPVGRIDNLYAKTLNCINNDNCGLVTGGAGTGTTLWRYNGTNVVIPSTVNIISILTLTNVGGVATVGIDTSTLGGSPGGLSTQFQYNNGSGGFAGSTNLTTNGTSIALVGNSTVTWDSTNSLLNFSTPIKSSGTTIGLSFIDRGLIVNNGGYSSAGQSADFIVKGNGSIYGVHYDPATNIFTSSAPFVAASQFSGSGLTTCGDSTHAVSWNSGTNNFGCQSITGTGGGGGGGGVNSGTIGQVAYYAVNGTTVSGNSNLIVNTSSIAINQTSTGNIDALTITSTGTGVNLQVTPQGFISNGYQNKKGAVTIGDDSSTRVFSTELVLVDSTTDSQNGGGMLELWSDNPNHNDPKIWIHTVGHDSSPEIRDDSNAPNWEMINTSTNNTQGLGKFEPAAVAYQGVDLQRNSRSQDNTTFQTVEYMHPLSRGGGLELTSALNNDGNTYGIDTAPLQFDTTNSHVVGLTGPMATTTGWTFALPRTFNNLGQVLYQSDNGRGGPSNARSWDFTTGGSTGQFLQYNSGAAPTWATPSGSGTTIYNATSTAGFPFGFSASTGVFTSTITGTQLNITSITVSSIVTLPNKASGSPSLTRSNDTTTGVGFQTNEVDLDVNGIAIISANSNQANLNAPARIIDTFVSSTNTASLSIQTAPGSGDLEYYVRQNFTHQNSASVIRGLGLGLRDKTGEDPYLFISNYDADTGFAPNDVFHVNVSSYSTSSGNVGLEISTPTAKLHLLAKGTQTYSIALSSAGSSAYLYNVSTNGYISTNGPTPTINSCGTATIVGDDNGGDIIIASAVNTSCSIFWAKPKTKVPHCTVSDDVAAVGDAITSISTTGMTIGFAANFSVGGGGNVYYVCDGKETP